LFAVLVIIIGNVSVSFHNSYCRFLYPAILVLFRYHFKRSFCCNCS